MTVYSTLADIRNSTTTIEEALDHPEATGLVRELLTTVSSLYDKGLTAHQTWCLHNFVGCHEYGSELQSPFGDLGLRIMLEDGSHAEKQYAPEDAEDRAEWEAAGNHFQIRDGGKAIFRTFEHYRQPPLLQQLNRACKGASATHYNVQPYNSGSTTPHDATTLALLGDGGSLLKIQPVGDRFEVSIPTQPCPWAANKSLYDRLPHSPIDRDTLISFLGTLP